MTKTQKQGYLTPQVDQLVTRVERGFAGSGASTPQGTQATRASYGDDDPNGNNKLWN